MQKSNIMDHPDRSSQIMNDHSTNLFNTYTSTNPLKDTGVY
jgi:hypothetical protein